VAESGPRAGLGPRAAAALVAGAAALAYATSFLGGFQFDDWNVIIEDLRVQTLGAWWASLPAIRPLLKLTFALNLQAGTGLAGFHAFNLGVHAAAALAAWALVARVEAGGAPVGDGQGTGAPAGGWVAMVAALLFALHPVQTEAVTYLSGRSASLAGLLALASALSWLEGRARGSAALVHGLSPLLMAASLLVKESAVALPLALLALAAATRPGWRAALRDTATHWLLLAGAAAAYAASPTYRAMAAHAAGLRPAGANLLAHLDGLGWLLGQVLQPWAVASDPAWPAMAGLTARGAAALAALGALALTGLARPARPWGTAALWTLAWLPVSGWLLPRPEPASDRQLYLALLGPAWLAARALAGGSRAGSRRSSARPPAWHRLRLVTAGALIVLLGALTGARNLVYRDEVAFWSDAAARAPGAARPLNNLGLALSAACRLPEAEAAFEAALAAEPGHPRARVNLWLLRAGSPPGARRGEVAPCRP